MRRTETFGNKEVGNPDLNPWQIIILRVNTAERKVSHRIVVH